MFILFFVSNFTQPIFNSYIDCCNIESSSISGEGLEFLFLFSVSGRSICFSFHLRMMSIYDASFVHLPFVNYDGIRRSSYELLIFRIECEQQKIRMRLFVLIDRLQYIQFRSNLFHSLSCSEKLFSQTGWTMWDVNDISRTVHILLIFDWTIFCWIVYFFFSREPKSEIDIYFQF